MSAMSPTPNATNETAGDAWWRRLHHGLMPDYNRQATVYWWVMVLLGAAVLVNALRSLLALPPASLAQVGAGVVIAMLAGLFPVRIPRSKNSFAAGEIFIFLLLFLHGPAAATLAAACEAFVGSWRTSKRWTSRLASPAIGCIAMYCAGSLLQLGIDAARGVRLRAQHGADHGRSLPQARPVADAARTVRQLRLGRHHLCRQRLTGVPPVPDLPAVGHRGARRGHADHRHDARHLALLLSPAGGRRGGTQERAGGRRARGGPGGEPRARVGGQRGQAAAHRLPRQPHRAAESPQVPGASGADAGARPDRWAAPVRSDVPRLRSLQAHQRQPGARRRRRVPGRGFAPHPAPHASARH